MNLSMIIWSVFVLLTATTRLDCGGGGQGPGNGFESNLIFQCEYDHSQFCNVFPGSDHTFVSEAFYDANTSFAAIFSEQIGSYNPTSDLDVLAIAKDEADWDGSFLFYESYLASLKKWEGSTPLLGVTLYGGVAHKAICVVFYDDIVAYAANHSLDQSQLRKAVVIHELGHGRANLPHLCDGPNVRTYDHSSPNSFFTCVMVDPLKNALCLEGTDAASPLESIGFCGKCDDKLKQVLW